MRRAGWSVFRRLFPSFAHDVVWNHSLCKIRYLAEIDEHPEAAEGIPCDSRADSPATERPRG